MGVYNEILKFYLKMRYRSLVGVFDRVVCIYLERIVKIGLCVKGEFFYDTCERFSVLVVFRIVDICLEILVCGLFLFFNLLGENVYFKRSKNLFSLVKWF